MLPLWFNLKNVPCLVVGGGSVGLRVVRTLLAEQAMVIVVSPNLHPELEELTQTEKITVAKRNFTEEDLFNVQMAFLCTSDNALHQEIRQRAPRYKVLVNDRAEGMEGDFIQSACKKDENLGISWTTWGKSPSLSRFLKDRLTDYLEWDKISKLSSKLGEFRADDSIEKSKKQEIMQKLVQSDVLVEWLNDNPQALEELLSCD